jgi:hypothetical protein
MRELEQRTTRETFLNSAKFVLEKLNSLSVDLNRVLASDIPEKVWKEYYAGDTTVFTRRLLGMRDQIPTEKIRNKYENDHEFRTYVQRYFRLYEEMFDQAVTLDHGDMLTATFMSSDIGKLYHYLSRALDYQRKKAKAS